MSDLPQILQKTMVKRKLYIYIYIYIYKRMIKK